MNTVEEKALFNKIVEREAQTPSQILPDESLNWPLNYPLHQGRQLLCLSYQ